jgi:hypothetical protein
MSGENIKILYDKVREIKAQPYRYIPYYDQLNMKEWAYFRLYVIISKGRKCELCDYNNMDHLQVHHPEYKKQRMLWQYELSEVMVLCKQHHKKVHMPKLREKHNKTKSIKKIVDGKKIY